MDIKDILLFLSIAEEHNLTRAAGKNGYSQSAASHILKNLEADLGFPLFSRSQKGVVLTSDGEALLPYVRRILSATECFEQKVSAIRGIEAGRIAIGVLTDSFCWLPMALKEFYEHYPHIIVETREGTSPKINAWLECGMIDFAFTCSDSSQKMDWIPLLKESYLAVCSPDSPYAEKDGFDLKNLQETPYMKVPGDRDLPRLLSELGIEVPMPVFSSLNISSMTEMAAHNLGVCILPEPVLKNNKKQDMVLLPLVPPIERELGILLPSLTKASPAARLLIAQFQKTICEAVLPAP